MTANCPDDTVIGFGPGHPKTAGNKACVVDGCPVHFGLVHCSPTEGCRKNEDTGTETKCTGHNEVLPSCGTFNYNEEDYDCLFRCKQAYYCTPEKKEYPTDGIMWAQFYKG